MELAIIPAAHRAGLQMASFRERQWDDPEGAVEALAKFGGAITDAFNAKVKSIYGGAALASAGDDGVHRGGACLPAAGTKVSTSALLQLTVVKKDATFELATFLDGKQPTAADVVVQERLARL